MLSGVAPGERGQASQAVSADIDKHWLRLQGDHRGHRKRSCGVSGRERPKAVFQSKRMKTPARFSGKRTGAAGNDFYRPDKKAGRGQAFETQEGGLSETVVMADFAGHVDGGGKPEQGGAAAEKAKG